MKSIREVLGGVTIGRMRAGDSSSRRAIVSDALDVARAWDRGELPLTEARKLTGDGWLKCQITRRMIPGTEEGDVWLRFVEAIYQFHMRDCDQGGFDVNGRYFAKLDVVAHGGTVGPEVDEVTGELVCVARFPKLDLQAMTRSEKAQAYPPSPYAPEWDQ